MSRTQTRRAFRLGLLVSCLVGSLLAAAPARSSELVAVRVGTHPTFTRVVFEFDAPTGYRVERRAEGEGASTILVTLDADSRTRSIASGSPGVKSVSVEGRSGRALARIVARKPGLPIKEMILNDPPRIVLDLMVAAAPPVPAPEKAQTPVVEPTPEPALARQPEAEAPPVVPEPEPAEPVLAEPEPAEPEPELAESEFAEPEPEVAEPEPARVETEFEPFQIAEPAEPAAEPGGDFPELQAEVPEAEAEIAEAQEPVAEIEEAAPEAETEPAPEAEPPSALPLRRAPEEADTAPRRAAEARARLAAEAESRGAPFDIETVGAAAGGVLLLLLVVFLVVRRRRSLPNDMDVTALAAGDEDAASASADERIPRGGFSMGAPASGAAAPDDDFEFAGSETASDEEKPIERVATGPAAGPGLFDESPQEKESTTMENQGMPITHMDSEAPTRLGIGGNVVGAGGDSQIARLVQELERRIAHLETRLDEANEARERLERQVSAQSEELRVQRAAIARTQRALRSLNRSEEDQATEPALRDPSKPAGVQ